MTRRFPILGLSARCSPRASLPRTLSVLAALMVTGAGCASSVETADSLDGIGVRPATTEPWSEFCGGAVALVEYLDANAAALFDPSMAADFLSGARGRLAGLEDSAPREMEAEVVALRRVYDELDRLLDEVDHDVTRVDGESLLARIDTEASRSFDEYLIAHCGLGAAPDGVAPEILSEDELARLLGEQPDEAETAEADRVLSALLSEVSGWSGAQIECVISDLSAPSKDELVNGGLAGGPISPEATEEFARSRAICGIEEAGS